MKTIITKLLMLTAVLSASTNIYAYDFEVDGLYFNVIDFNDLTCKIVRGDKVYTGEIKIPSQITFNDRTFLVTEISDDAFTNSDITSITIPNTIEQISDEAFEKCSKLKEFTIEDGENDLRFVNSSIFVIEYDLETLYLGRNISFDSNSPFDASYLSKLTISNYVTNIPKGLFGGSVTNLKELIIKDSTYSLTIHYNNYGWNDDMEDDLPSIRGCQLETFYLGRNISLQYISHYETPAIEGNANKFILSPNVTRIGYECGIDANSIHVPDLSTWCNIYFVSISLKPSNPILHSSTKLYINGNLPINITIPEDVTFIRDYSFSNCNSLESVTIGENVTSIGEYAFSWCSNLNTVTIGKNVTSIGSNAFYNCPKNIEINTLNPIPPAISTNTFENKQYLYATLIVPDCSLEAYKTADGLKNFFNIASTNSVKPDAIKVGTNDNNIIINGVGNAVAEVYNLSGQLVYSGTDTVINMPSKGIYIVRVSGQTFKVIL